MIIVTLIGTLFSGKRICTKKKAKVNVKTTERGGMSTSTYMPPVTIIDLI